VSIIPRTIWRNSSSEGMHPAPKTQARKRLHLLALRNREAI
jgi:hypothetical protein